MSKESHREPEFPIPHPYARPGQENSFHEILATPEGPVLVDGRGHTTNIDPQDVSRLAQLRSLSSFFEPNTQSRYFTTTIGGKTVTLHYYLCGMPEGYVVHHRDGVTTNNRLRSNLEVVSDEEHRKIPRAPHGANHRPTGVKGITLFWWPDETHPDGGHDRLRALTQGPFGQIKKRFENTTEGWEAAERWLAGARSGEIAPRPRKKRFGASSIKVDFSDEIAAD